MTTIFNQKLKPTKMFFWLFMIQLMIFLNLLSLNWNWQLRKFNNKDGQ